MKRMVTILLAVGLFITPALALAVSIDFDVAKGAVDTTRIDKDTWIINSISRLNIFQISAFGTTYDGTYSSEAPGGISSLFLDYNRDYLSISGIFSGIDELNAVPNILDLKYDRSAPLLTAYVGRLTFGQEVTNQINPFTLGGIDYKDGDFLKIFGLFGTPGATNPWNFDLRLDFVLDFNDEDKYFFVADGTLTNTPVPEPGTMMLLGSGLVGLIGWGRKRIRG